MYLLINVTRCYTCLRKKIVEFSFLLGLFSMLLASLKRSGLFGLTYLSLYVDIITCEIAREFMKPAYFHKLYMVTYAKGS